jgi:hypothetical protein
MFYASHLALHYHITLPAPSARLVDRHFEAACFHRRFEARSYMQRALTPASFHHEMSRRHLDAMLSLIREHGDFHDAVDPEGGPTYLFAQNWTLENGLPMAELMHHVPCRWPLKVGDACPEDTLLYPVTKVAA